MKSSSLLWSLMAAGALSMLTGCIHNDLPFPRISQDILSISAVGETAPAKIDDSDYQVTLYLGETVNPHEVRFDDFTYTEGADVSLNLLEGTYDLTKPIKVVLSKYQSYEWVITAQQEIERYFTIAGQIGASVIDVPGRRVIVDVPESADISALEVTSIKLGPAEVTTMSPDITPGIYDFSHPMTVQVSYFGNTEEWTIYVNRTKQLVATAQVDAWAQVIWAYGNGPDDAVNGFQYRRADSDEWINVPDSWITHDGGSFRARIIHLEPLTQYVVRAVSGENIGNEVTVTTEPTMILPDGDFDQWWLDGKIWCPWDKDGVRYWDTGNTGAATLGQSNVVPTDYTANGQGQAAQLNTKFVGIGIIGKLAAGSIYTGSFKKVDGTNGILDFGRPWNLHPTKMRGYYQYKSVPIDYASADFKHLIGTPDECNIYILLADWTAPFEIRTNPKNQNLLDLDSPSIIAYGNLSTSETTDRYQEFVIELEYRSTSRIPTYILVCCAASKYGDYFTGGAGSVLYVDQFSLEYDY